MSLARNIINLLSINEEKLMFSVVGYEVKVPRKAKMQLNKIKKTMPRYMTLYAGITGHGGDKDDVVLIGCQMNRCEIYNSPSLFLKQLNDNEYPDRKPSEVIRELIKSKKFTDDKFDTTEDGQMELVSSRLFRVGERKGGDDSSMEHYFFRRKQVLGWKNAKKSGLLN
jgi:hypothetical protein